jgi:hypothetical protein
VIALTTKSELIQALLKLGENSSDFRITASTDSDLLLEQKIVDAKFYGVASEERLKKVYGARIWIDDGRKEVKYQEILADRSSVIGVLPTPQQQFEKSIWKGKVLFKKEKGVGFGFKKPLDPRSFGKVYDYSFDNEKIRQPIRQAVENAGWKFNQVILGQ